MEKESALKAG